MRNPPTKLMPIPCPNCGNEFKPKAAAKKYCSLLCANGMGHKRFRAQIQSLLDSGDMPRTPEEAQKLGLTVYLTKPCNKGHLGVRSQKNGTCIDCERAKKVRKMQNKKAPRVVVIAPNESLLTSPVWLHILPTWQAVVVHRA